MPGFVPHQVWVLMLWYPSSHALPHSQMPQQQRTARAGSCILGWACRKGPQCRCGGCERRCCWGCTAPPHTSCRIRVPRETWPGSAAGWQVLNLASVQELQSQLQPTQAALERVKETIAAQAQVGQL